MDKNQPFFDPYNFNMQNTTPQPNIDPTMDQLNNPMMYYEQQYMYYRYLTQVLEYRIRLKELENLNNNTKTN